MGAKKSPALIAKQAERCYELAAAGMSTRAIAEEMGISQSVVVRRMHNHIKEHEHNNADKWREMQLADLMNLRRRLQKQVETGDIKAIGQAVRIWERIARMLGTDSATLFKLEATTVSRESDANDVQKMLDGFFGRDTTQPGEPKVIPHIDVTQRRRRPVPQAHLEKSAKEDAYHREMQARAAEKRGQMSNAEAEVLAEFDTMDQLDDIEEQQARAEGFTEPVSMKDWDRKRRRPASNPAHRFLRDSDDD